MEQGSKLGSQEVPKAPDQKEDVYTMEVGRLKERLAEMIKILPGTMVDVARIWVLAAKALGTPEKEIAMKLKEIIDRMSGRANDGRETADKRFEEKSSLEE